ncbi:MAG: hypothetical protein FWF91_00780 [Coriobacteriia bacterium]|nr:hypothetical protein [Coriobacteriia bacterium]
MSGKQIRIASFIGGLVFFSTITVVLLMKNDKIRAEVEEQAMSILKTTKSAVSQIQFVVSKIGGTTGKNTDAKYVSVNENTKENIDNSVYDAQWASLELEA